MTNRTPTVSRTRGHHRNEGHDSAMDLLRFVVCEPINGDTDYNVIAAFESHADANIFMWSNLEPYKALSVRNVGTAHRDPDGTLISARMTSSEDLITEAKLHNWGSEVDDYELPSRLIEALEAAKVDLASRDAQIAEALNVEVDRSLPPERFWPKYKDDVRAALAQSPADALDPFAPVRDQRERQIAMGFDAAHDDAHGREHLIEAAKSYAVHGDLVKAAAMVMALSHYDERRKREARTTPTEGASA